MTGIKEAKDVGGMKVHILDVNLNGNIIKSLDFRQDWWEVSLLKPAWPDWLTAYYANIQGGWKL